MMSLKPGFYFSLLQLLCHGTAVYEIRDQTLLEKKRKTWGNTDRVLLVILCCVDPRRP